jgi:hypothetical protein
VEGFGSRVLTSMDFVGILSVEDEDNWFLRGSKELPSAGDCKGMLEPVCASGFLQPIRGIHNNGLHNDGCVFCRKESATRVPGQGLYPTRPLRLRNQRRRRLPHERQQTNQKGHRFHPQRKDRRVQGQRSQPQECKPEVKRAELEACDQGAA